MWSTPHIRIQRKNEQKLESEAWCDSLEDLLARGREVVFRDACLKVIAQ